MEKKRTTDKKKWTDNLNVALKRSSRRKTTAKTDWFQSDKINYNDGLITMTRKHQQDGHQWEGLNRKKTSGQESEIRKRENANQKPKRWLSKMLVISKPTRGTQISNQENRLNSILSVSDDEGDDQDAWHLLLVKDCIVNRRQLLLKSCMVG